MKFVPQFGELVAASDPFRHFLVTGLFSNSTALELSTSIEAISDWKFVKTDFYEQFEISLFDFPANSKLRKLVADTTVAPMTAEICRQFKKSHIQITDATLHKLVDGQAIGIHNDYLSRRDTFRLVVHLTRSWIDDYGGYFVLFSDADPESVSQLIRPQLNSAICFEISKESHHAVSQVRDQDRYSLVYSFSAP